MATDVAQTSLSEVCGSCLQKSRELAAAGPHYRFSLGYPRQRETLEFETDLNRQSDRVTLSLPIRVIGTDTLGREFRDEARTILVTRHGARILLARELDPKTEITIRYPRIDREAKARIIGKAAESPDGNQYGVRILDTSVNLWGIHFPAAAEAESAVGRVLLECTSCHAQEVACLDGLALGVFQANRTLSRPCKCSPAMTAWSEVSSDGTVGPVAAVAAAVATKLVSTARVRNLREGLEQSWKIHACVRSAEFGEEIVLTDNPTRTGVRYMSENKYEEGEKVDIAIPYQRAGGNVFIPAQIKWTMWDPEEGISLSDVIYLRRVRKSARYEATIEVHMGILGVGLRLTGKIVDLSMTGVLMKTSRKLEPDTHVRLGIEMGVDTFRTVAIVRRTVPGVGVAFEFAQMNQRDRQLLGRLIQLLKLSVKS